MSQSRIELISSAKSAINAATFAPTEQRVSEARQAIQALFDYVETLTPKASPEVSQPKAAKAAKVAKQPQKQSKTSRPTPEELTEAKQQRESRGIATTYLPKEEVATKPKAEGKKPKVYNDEVYHSIEDAVRDIRTMKLRAAELEAKAAKELAKQEMQMDLFDLDPIEDCITFDDIPF